MYGSDGPPVSANSIYVPEKQMQTCPGPGCPADIVCFRSGIVRLCRGVLDRLEISMVVKVMCKEGGDSRTGGRTSLAQRKRHVFYTDDNNMLPPSHNRKSRVSEVPCCRDGRGWGVARDEGISEVRVGRLEYVLALACATAGGHTKFEWHHAIAPLSFFATRMGHGFTSRFRARISALDDLGMDMDVPGRREIQSWGGCQIRRRPDVLGEGRISTLTISP